MAINPNAQIKTIEKFQQPEAFFYGIYFSAERQSASSPLGHAFVIFHKGKEVVTFESKECFGLYPNNDSKWSLLFGQQGTISTFEEKTDLALHVFVSSSIFNAALSRANAFKANAPQYALINMDTCVSLLKTIAVDVALIAPIIILNPYPEDWVKALMDSN